MSRVTILRVRLSIDERWAVGAVPAVDGDVQVPVLLDARASARPHLPGSSLAGSLRRHLGVLAKDWLGPEPGAAEAAGQQRPTPGRLVLLGTRLPDEVGMATGGRTQIDDDRGAAAENMLRTERWVEPCVVVILAEHQGVPDATLLDALATWRPVIGRGYTVGLGQARVTGVRAADVDLADPVQLTWWLAERAVWLEFDEPVATSWMREQTRDADQDEEGRALVVDRVWTVQEPVHVGGSDPTMDEAGRETAAPMRRGKDFVIPGSSWKGIYRHRVTAVLRYVGADPALLDRVVSSLFGSTTRRGLLTFRESVVNAGPVTRSHVAIDRFTGGALEGGLFQVEAIESGAVVPQQVEAAETLPAALANVLDHVARDINDGLVGVGANASRGYGWLRVPDGTPPPSPLPVDVAEIDAALAELDARAGTPSTSRDAPKGAPEEEAR